MKTAFAYWDDRIAPVFDTAQQIHVVEVDSGRIVRQSRETLPEDPSIRKTLRLVELGIGALVCGAISKPMHDWISAYGIQAIPFVRGELHDVVQAWLDGSLESATFAMPGCFGRGRRFRCGEYDPETEDTYEMNGKGRGGKGQGSGQGQGQGSGRGRGQGRGRGGGAMPLGDADVCVCPKCGHREPHERGVPCLHKQCPLCGTAMTRQ